MSQFTGRSVTVKLTDGNTVIGIVNRVANGQLDLANAVFPTTGAQFPIFALSATMIKDIDVLPTTQAQASTNTSTPIASRAPSQVSHTSSDTTQESFFEDPNSPAVRGSHSPPHHYQNQKRKDHNRRQNPHQKAGSNRPPPQEDWDADLDAIKSMEFDFQKNLDLFDKKSVFEEIKKHDTVDPVLRLHSHNKNNNTTQKYGNLEMVLPDSRGVQRSASPIKPSGSAGGKPRRYVIVNRAAVPLISPLQRVELDSFMKDQVSAQAENAGRGIAHVVLQALGGTARFTPENHNASPVVVILGAGKISESTNIRAASAARFLRNRGIVVHHWKEVPEDKLEGPVELIIDAISGIEADPDEDPDPQTLSLTQWANSVHMKRVPVLAIDVPSLWIERPPKWIVCCGLPSSAIPPAYTDTSEYSSATTIYIVDINIASTLLVNRFARFKPLYFGAEFIVQAYPGNT